MKLQSSSGFIKLNILLLVLNFCAYSQDPKLERLAMQYRLTQPILQSEKERLQLAIADKYINEGDYTRAINLNAKIEDNTNTRARKYLISAKAEFLIDNYSESLAFLNKIDKQTADKSYYKEIQLYRLLNFSHLIYKDSIYRNLTQAYLENGKDTTGIYTEMNLLKAPKFLDLKKAKRRSFFPGAGLCYVGERRHALGSAFLCFAFLGYTAYSIYTKYYITGALTGLSQFQRFYNGGKRASVKLGNKKNREAYIKYVLSMNNYIEEKILAL